MTNTSEQHKRDLDTFYQLMDLLQQRQGFRYLSECTAELHWPKKGVYFFYEPDELRTGGNSKRVVRVGTHAVSTGSTRTLWDRLRTHRGTTAGGGNHRASVFRKLIGLALIERNHITSPGATTWGHGNSAPKAIRVQETNLEKQVSEHIGNLPFVWVEIDDPAGPDSKRKYIERNSIALLSNINGNPDTPSDCWLGSKCPHKDVKDSGLWNSDHVREEYNPEFLIDLKRYVEKTNRTQGT